MNVERVPFQKIIFVCINRRPSPEACCAARDSEAIAAALKAQIKARGLSGRIRVSKSGCQDLCAKGPNVMVFPDHVCYSGVTEADLPRILEDVTRGVTSQNAPSGSAG